MTWIGACLVAAFLIGALIGSVFSRKREDSERDQSHSDKLNYPTDTNHETSIAALARSQIAFAKDYYAAQERDITDSRKTYKVGFWTAIGVGAYTVLTSVIVIFSVVQYGEIHRFNKRQLRFFTDQVSIMRGQLAEMQVEQRPWISLEMEIGGPLIFLDSGGRMVINVTLKNWGKQPAKHVSIFPRFVLSSVKTPLSADNELQNLCETGIWSSLIDYGYFMFPGKTISIPWSIPIGRKEWNDVIRNFPSPLPQGSINPVIINLIGCAQYTFTSDDDIHITPFKAGFTLNISEAPNQITRIAPDMMPTGSVFPIEKLRLEASPFGITPN